MLELLSPAGNIEKLKTAILFGADAVYAGFEDLSLRAAGLSLEEIAEGVSHCHQAGKKFYLALNIFAFNNDVERIEKILPELEQLQIDALIISDPGLVALIREKAPAIKIHLSTQANTTNWRSAQFWHNQGVTRLVLARELSLKEIREIKEHVPDLELEMFVHGAMCMAFSGRCLLSSYLTGRNANCGDCAQPCRWEYGLVELEPTREMKSVSACAQSGSPEPELIIGETQRGVYIMNSRDLCLIEYLKEIYDAGVSAIKIEGRMKPAYYVALTAKVYREAIDLLLTCAEDGAQGNNVCLPKYLYAELQNVSHRPFTHGFIDGKENSEMQRYESSKYIRPFDFVGIVSSYDKGRVYINARNKIEAGEEIEFLDPNVPIKDIRRMKVNKIINQKDGQEIPSAHNSYKIIIECPDHVSEGSVVRKRVT
ncbi:MAG: U32 family peptidase [Candidatus Margulisiibacteriota bacterium]